MTRAFCRSRIAVLLSLFASAISVPAWAELIGAEDLLQRLEKNITGTRMQVPTKGAQLLMDIKRFRIDSGTMDANRAAATWLKLYDQAVALGPVEFSGDYGVFDAEVGNVVGLHSLLGSLPPPEAWPALREGAKSRAARTPANSQALAFRLITELLAGDHRASAATLAAIDDVASKLSPNEREPLRAQAAFVRAEMARLYGSPEEIAATFLASMELLAGRGRGEVAIPDLVGLVGEVRAASILRELLVKPVRLRVPEGDRTRALARRIGLEQLAALRLPQWGLVDSIEAAELYEGLTRRFVGVAADGPKAATPGEYYDHRKSEADVYYLLYLVLQKRHADAEKVLRAAAGQQELNLSRRAAEALERGGHSEALFLFLHSLLERRPELRAWGVYTKQAAYTGNSAEALKLVNRLLTRPDLPDYVLADLRFHRVNALLAADMVEPGVAGLRELLLAPPTKGEERILEARSEAALRLAGLGRVLGRPDLSSTGLAFARTVLALPADRERSWQRVELLRKVLAEQRKLGLLEQAQATAIAELEKATGGAPSGQEQFGMGVPANERLALIELAGLFGEAKRHRDVITLLDESAKWGVRDLRQLATEKDSLGVPLGLTAARALAATGNSGAALALARLLVDSLPGHDAAYELLVDLDKEAFAYLKRAYAADWFEERPLIWMSILRHRANRDLEAESLVRQAIVIDPSDGEQGPSDRMRAYAVLADILEAKGITAQARLFRNAVQAIRIAERSDELHRLGLHERAFAGYREALGHFSDAYCIQSRLAVRLQEQGEHKEAFEHYRRAYELMPSSFGRVESHCFGCESAFNGAAQQSIAEQVFTGMLRKDPNKPQLHYLLGYLQKERGLHAEALKGFRKAVVLDPYYLNAWKHLHETAIHVYMESRERDIARLKLLELDPRQRHVRYDLGSIGDLAGLWRAVAAVNAEAPPASTSALYPLRRSAAAQDEAQMKLPEPMRVQMQQYLLMMEAANPVAKAVPTSRQALGQHALIKASAALMGAREFGY